MKTAEKRSRLKKSKTDFKDDVKAVIMEKKPAMA